MKNELYVHHHLGLGDHITCNGMIRCLLKSKERIYLFVKHKTFNNVKRMYVDLQNKIELIPFENDQQIVNFVNKEKIENFLSVGHQSLKNIMNLGYKWDEAFYVQVGISFKERWESFYIERNLEDECILKNKHQISNDYAIVHGVDSSNTDRLDYEKINKNLQVIRIEKKYDKSIFDYIGLIQNAKEIHCINSSFIHLVDSYDLDMPLFYHKNFKKRHEETDHTLKNNWIIL